MSDKEWTGEFTAEEFLARAKEHERVAETALRVGPNIKYARTYQACAAAFRIAALSMEESN